MGLDEEIEKVDQEIKEKQAMYKAIERELEAIELQRTLLEAELAGLEQRRRSLAAAQSTVAGEGTTAMPRRNLPATDVTKLTLVDAVLHVINETGEAMRIDDVARRLRELGRDDNEASIPVTLNYLKTNMKIRWISRGVYGRIELGDLQ
jgi:chromosome segregation ATPase